MPFLGYYNQSEVDRFVADAIKEAIEQCNAANKSQVHIPSLKHYAGTINASIAREKFDTVVAARVNGNARMYAFACSEMLRVIHFFYDEQYNDLCRMYNQLLSNNEVLQELRTVKSLATEVLVLLEEKEKTK